MRWRDALRAFLDDFDRWRSGGEDTRRRKERGGLDPTSTSSSSRCNGDESPFEAARRRDLVALRHHFGYGCPVDRIDDATGDTVLLVACRLGFADVARLALVEYHGEGIYLSCDNIMTSIAYIYIWHIATLLFAHLLLFFLLPKSTQRSASRLRAGESPHFFTRDVSHIK